MFERIDQFKPWQKIFTALIHDFFVAILAFYLSLVLRFGDWFPAPVTDSSFTLLLIAVALTQTFVFYMNDLYKGLWRYSSISDLLRILKASTLAVPAALLVTFILTRLEGIPRGIVFIDWLLLVVGLGGGRLVYRMMRDHLRYGHSNGKKHSRVLIIGAGAGGERLLREIFRDDGLKLNVCGFVDDKQGLQKRSIHNVMVLGPISSLPTIIPEKKIKQIFIAIPTATSDEVRRIYELVKPFDIEIKLLPRMSEVFQGKIDFSKLQDIKIEDLLGREEVQLDIATIRSMLTGKKVFVTGAGGSIGSELCRQLAKFAPEKLIALDSSEYNSYALDYELKQNFSELNYEVIVGDVRDQQFINTLFERERPQVILHAAAYKHVPLMEFNPFQAIQTNIRGTKVVSGAAIKYQAEKFVLISTDKAVNPTNIMGATKRVAEILIEHNNNKSEDTKLFSVRFGNVLGSSGSVIPLFRKQIENGGPITVTHPEITRYFMSIQEASKLVLQAGAIGGGGELFVLDMGKPLRIYDLAEEMITLAGFEKNVDIDIEITGLRPGEKLYEEPLMDLEKVLATPHRKVKVCQARPPLENFYPELEALIEKPSQTSREEYIRYLNALVPEYNSFAVVAGKEMALAQTHH
jgi:FlaA1/EpsC-like NDP-sugar epimerase